MNNHEREIKKLLLQKDIAGLSAGVFEQKKLKMEAEKKAGDCLLRIQDLEDQKMGKELELENLDKEGG